MEAQRRVPKGRTDRKTWVIGGRSQRGRMHRKRGQLRDADRRAALGEGGPLLAIPSQ